MENKIENKLCIDEIKSNLLIFKLDLNGNIISCSTRLLKLLAFDRKSIINKHISKFIDYTTAKYTFDDLKILLNEVNTNLSVEHKILTLFRQYLYVYANYWYEYDNKTNEKFIIINLIDITSIQKETIDMKNKYFSYEETLDQLELAIAIVNFNGELDYCNREMNEFLIEIHSYYFDKINYKVFGEVIYKRIDDVMYDSTLKYEFEHSFKINEKERFYKVVIESLSRNKCRITLLNIQKEKTYEQIMDKLKIGLVFESYNGITYLNKRASEIFELKDKNQYINRKLIEYIGFEYKLKFLEHFYSNNDKKYSVHFTKSINDKEIIISNNKNYINEKDRKEKIYFIEEDVKRVLNHNSGYNDKKEIIEAKEYESLKNEFFANISHELRTPINVIYSIVQLAESIDSKEDSIYIKYNKILKQNCYRLIRLINNLIEITKIDSGHIEMAIGNYDIVNVVEEITLSVADYIESKGLELIFDTEIEELIIACDPDKIECIILNLLSNASKFTSPPGKIEVYMETIGNEYIKIHIKDNGQGIPASKQKSIFKRFRQVDKNLYRAHEGSGIGLSLVKSFIELHGGDISVESKTGEGSEFIIQLPIKVIEKNNHKKVKSYESEKIIDKINIEFSDIYF